ncbi:MAG: DUF3987 domain-containing protein [Pseudomonadota bacterium]
MMNTTSPGAGQPMTPVRKGKDVDWAKAFGAAADEQNWLVVEIVSKGGGKKPDKKPVNPKTRRPCSKDVAAALTLAEALKAKSELEANGKRYVLGYLPRKGSALVGIDLDKVLEPDGPGGFLIETATHNEFVKPGGYWEVSPSGTGLRGLIPRPPGDSDWQQDHGGSSVGYIGSAGKFFTVSGERIAGSAKAVSAVDGLYERVSEACRCVGSETGGSATQAAQAASQRPTAAKGWFDNLPSEELKAECLREALGVDAPDLNGKQPRVDCSDYDDWIAILAAIRDASNGEPWGFAVAQDWCRVAQDYNGDEELVKRWDGFKANRPGGATVGKILSRAAQAGWDAQPWKRRASTAMFDAVTTDAAASASCQGAISFSGQPALEPVNVYPERSLLQRMPGYAGEIARWAHGRGMRDNLHVAVGGTLAALSAVAGREYLVKDADPGGTALPIFVLLISGTAMGKDTAQRLVAELLKAATKMDRHADHLTSPAALSKTLSENPVLALEMDEIGRKLQAIASGTGSSGHQAELLTALMVALGRSTGRLSKRVYSDSKNNVAAVERPFVSLLGTTTRPPLFKALTSDNVMDGYLNRFVVLGGPDYAKRQATSDRASAQEPTSLTGTMTALASAAAFRRRTVGKTDAVVPIGISNAAMSQLKRLEDRGEATLEAGEPLAPLWGRARENAIRIAGVLAATDAAHAITLNPLDEIDVFMGNTPEPEPMITGEHMAWACALVEACVEGIGRDVEERVADGPSDDMRKRLLRRLDAEAESDGWALRCNVLRNVSKGPHRTRDLTSELDAMVEDGTLAWVLGTEIGRPSKSHYIKRRIG